MDNIFLASPTDTDIASNQLPSLQTDREEVNFFLDTPVHPFGSEGGNGYYRYSLVYIL
jgi:hypothetical protein